MTRSRPEGRGFGIFLALVVAGFVARSVAHPMDVGSVILEHADGPGRLRLTLEMNPQMATDLVRRAHGEPPSEEPLTPEEWARGLLVESPPEGECRVTDPRAEALTETRARIGAALECASLERFVWEPAWLKAAPEAFTLLVKANIGEGEEALTLTSASPRLSLNARPSRLGFGQFVVLGVKHIGAHPAEWRSAEGTWKLPDGIDHILFLLALVLMGGSLRSVLVTVTGFTVGHSVTLSLGALNWVHLPGRLVESVIALSIAWVAGANVLRRERRSDSRFWVATLFGFMHGLGFASILSELYLSRGSLASALVGFNVGVEAGQLLILAVVVPCLRLLRLAPKIEIPAMRMASAGVAVIGFYWFLQRAFAW